jgi:hypothetical protein
MSERSSNITCKWKDRGDTNCTILPSQDTDEFRGAAESFTLVENGIDICGGAINGCNALEVEIYISDEYIESLNIGYSDWLLDFLLGAGYAQVV